MTRPKLQIKTKSEPKPKFKTYMRPTLTIFPLDWREVKPTKMQEMRPISLCSVPYKVISKILCNRLKRVLPQIISETQGAFVSERLISDNILIAHEMVHGLKTNINVSEECMAVKTDMSKAYDRVEWSFLEVLLEKIGFDRRWVCWIMACVSSVTLRSY